MKMDPFQSFIVKYTLAMLIGTFVLVFSSSYFNAYFKAKAYNRLTGSNVSTWEAMYVPLYISKPELEYNED